MYWIGEKPFRANRQPIFASPNVKQIQLSGSSRDVLWFSRKPPDGFTDSLPQTEHLSAGDFPRSVGHT